MIENGTVVGTANGRISVRIEASDKCAGCGACSKGAEGGDMLMTDVVDHLGASAGDRVEVELPTGARTRAGLIVYALPVALLLFGYLAGSLLGNALGFQPDLTGALAALAAVLVFFWVYARKGRGLLTSEEDSPRVRAIIARVPSRDQ